MKVVLTGASSFSGLWFAQALAAGGHDVVMPLRATSIDSYSGIRAARVARLQSLGRVV
jgi:nucleoside-diphosphate-sugar epimerase